MSRVRFFGWVSVIILVLLFPCSGWGQFLPLPGPSPIAPASDGSQFSPDTLRPPPLRGHARDIRVAKRFTGRVSGIIPDSLQSDRGASSRRGPDQVVGQTSPQGEFQAQNTAPALTATFNGIDDTGDFPPDPVIAAGPGTLVLTTNGSVTIRSKTGALVASTSLEAFFGSVRALDEIAYDPRVVYDPGSNRFFLMAVGDNLDSGCPPETCVSHLFLAVSKTSNPRTTASGDWYVYAFDATLDGTTPTTNRADFSGLGVDGSVVVLTTNMYSFSSDEFQRSKIRILNKSALVAGEAATWTDFVGMTDPVSDQISFSLQPALTFGSPSTFFLVSASSTWDSCDLVVWGIQNALSAPALSAQTAATGGTCTYPPAAPQLGGGTPLDTGDNRVLNAVYRNGSLWTAQSIGMSFAGGDVSAIRWVQIDVSGWPTSVSLTQDSTFGADGISYFYPAVMVDASNNLAITLARSSPSEYGSAYYTGRLTTDTLNTLQPSALLKAGIANQNLLDGGGFNRYGDYLGIALDPSDGSFWILGEYVVTASTWGTWVGRLAFMDPVPTLTSLSPPSAVAGGAGFTLMVTGSDFVPTSVVRWNGTDRGTTFVNSSLLQAAISASDIAATGSPTVTVFSPSPGGGTSNSVTFTVTPLAFSLTLMKTATGIGSVTSSPAGLDCGPSCSIASVAFDSGTYVTLTATAAADSAFTGWSGEGCSGTGTCSVTMTQPRSVTATFLPLAAATISTSPTGRQITVDGQAYTAPQTFSWLSGSVHTLAAPSPQDGAVGARYVFDAWSDSGSQTHVVTAPGTPTSYTASFDVQYALTISISPASGGTVTPMPPGDMSGLACATVLGVICPGYWYYPDGTPVTLTATPNTGYIFAGWGGDCQGSGPCTVSMTQARSVTASFRIPDKVGVFRAGLWYLDQNGNGTWDGCGADTCIPWGDPGDKLVLGDWNGDGHTKIGIYRPQDATWYLDATGDGVFEGCAIDNCFAWGGDPSDIPVVGDWNGDGKTKVGIYRKATATWYLDYNGNGVFDGCDVDKCFAWGGDPADIPVVGDWNGNGKTKIGIYRNGTWYLDVNGNGVFEGCDVDKCFAWGGDPADKPVLGDWNGDGKTKIGIYRNGTWYLDVNGNGVFEGCSTDKCFAWGGDPVDKPVLGDWNGDGKTKIGIARGGDWYLDYNGNGVFDGCGTDKCLAWGDSSDQVVVGRW